MEVYSETATVEDAKLKTCTLKDTRKKKKDTRMTHVSPMNHSPLILS